MKNRAFSLVEVVLAVGVVAFAFVAILGLIPAGLTQFRQAMDTSVGAQVGQRVIMDAQQSEFETLIDYENTSGQSTNFTFRGPTMSAPAFRYFDEQGDEVIPVSGTLSPAEKARVVYWVNTRIQPRTPLPATIGGDDSKDIATVTVEVAFNPGNKDLKVVSGASDQDKPNRNLIDLTHPNSLGVTVKTYAAQIGKNQ